MTCLYHTNRTIDDFEVFMEAFYLANRYLTEVSIGWIAQYLGEEMNSFLFIEQIMLPLFTIVIRACISMFVDPL